MRCSLTFAVLALAITPAWVAVPTDVGAINLLGQRQANAWNAHDINAYSSLFVAAAHVVNVLGWHWTSRAELQQKLGRAFASVFAKSRMTIEGTTVDFLKPDIAVAHVSWTMTGALSPPRAQAAMHRSRASRHKCWFNKQGPGRSSTFKTRIRSQNDHFSISLAPTFQPLRTPRAIA